MTRTIKVVLVVLLLIGLAAAGAYWRRMSEITVAIVPVQTGVEVRVFAFGSVEAHVLSKVGFQVAGKLVEVPADQGDAVQKGGLLAKLDDAAQRTKLLKTEVTVRQAAANLARAQAQGERAASAYQQKKSVNTRRQTLLSNIPYFTTIAAALAACDALEAMRGGGSPLVRSLQEWAEG